MKTSAPVVLLAVAAMALSLTTLGALLGVRLVASDRLRQMSEAMKELGNASIETTITLRQTLPLPCPRVQTCCLIMSAMR
jgi:hypothetical protein